MVKAIFPGWLKRIPWYIWLPIVVALFVISIFFIYMFIAVLGMIGFIILFAAIGDDWFY